MISVGPMAERESIDLTEATISVGMTGNPPPKINDTGIKVDVNMPAGLSPIRRSKLERAADVCPIKHSFKDGIEPMVVYHYPD